MAGGFMDTSERGLRFMADSDFNSLAERVSEELSRRSLLRDCKSEVDARIDAYERAAATEAKNIKDLQQGAVVGPGERIVVDGKTYKNVARVRLYRVQAGPVNFAAGWAEP